MTAAAGHDETQLCHWSQLVTGVNWCFLPAVLGGNFAATDYAHEHETFKYL